MALTENMRLILPTPLPSTAATVGPTYATENNNAFSKIDSHNHTLRRGVRIPSGGLLINDNIDFSEIYGLISLRTIRLQNQSEPLALSSDTSCLYVSDGELFYNNATVTSIQLTDNGSIDITSIGTIGGDYGSGPESVYYTSASKKFYWTQDTNEGGFMDFGALILRATGINANAVTIQTPHVLAGSYTLTFPAFPLSGTKILRLSSGGAITSTLDVDNTTIEVLSSIQVKPLSINTTQLANGAATPIKFQSMNYAISASSGNWFSSNPAFALVVSCSITTTGKRVQIFIQPDGSTDLAQFGCDKFSTGTGGVGIQWKIQRDSTDIAWSVFADTINGSGAFNAYDSPGSACIWDNPSAGTYTYTLRMALGSGNAASARYVRIVAIEEVWNTT